MKLTSTQIGHLRTALTAAKTANVSQVALYANMIRGVSDTENSIIFSKLDLGLAMDVQVGIGNVDTLVKRLMIFGDAGLTLEGEVGADNQTIKRLSIKAPNGKTEFRCSSIKHIKHPKNTPDDLDNITLARDTKVATLVLTLEELQQLSRGAKTLGTEAITIQLKADGGVKAECYDTDNNVFTITLKNPCVFEDDEFSVVHSYAAGSSGVLLTLMENMARERQGEELIEFPLYSNGMIGCRVNGHFILAAKRADRDEGDDE
jgi:hypothetical protein